MLIGYCKYSIVDAVGQVYKRLLYSRRNSIQRGVYIGRDINFGGGVWVGYDTVLEKNVELLKNSRVGNRSHLSNISVGESSHIESRVTCTGSGAGRIVIGGQSYIGIGCILDWSGSITVGSNVHSCGHLFTHSSVGQALSPDLLNDKNRRTKAPITIEDNVYIGYGSIVYPGVTISHHSVVLPNTVVNKDVSAYSMVGGVPFKLIRQIT